MLGTTYIIDVNVLRSDVTAGYESDEETLLVDQVYYTNEDVDRAEMKYEEALSPQSLGKDNIYGAPDLVLGSNYLAANDLLDNWPHMSEGGSVQRYLQSKYKVT